MALREIPGAKYLKFKKGDIIINEGEEVTDLYYLVSGKVERISINENGEKNIIEIKADKNGIASMLGVSYAYHENNHSQFVFKTCSECECYKVAVNEYKKWVHDKPDVLEEIIMFFVKESAKSRRFFNARIKGDTSKELCTFLIKNAVKTKDGYIVPSNCCLKDFAAVIGVHKGTLSRIMKKLKEENIVERCQEGIKIVDYEKLKIYSEEEMKYK